MKIWNWVRAAALGLLARWAGIQGLWSQGHVGFFGLTKEVAWGSPLAVSDYGEILSENLVTTIDRFGTRNIYSGYFEPDDTDGARRSTGGIVMAAFPGMLGHLLKATFNSISQSTVLSGFLWTNNYSSVKSEFADGVPRQPYTLEVFRDVGSSHQYAGALLSKLTLALAPNQDLRVTAEWLAKSRALLARTTPTFPGSPVDPFTWDTASVSIGGAASARVEAFTLTVDNQLEGILALNNSTEIARIRATNPQMIRISGTLDFIDVAEQQDFINQTERSLKLNLTLAQSFNLLLDAPRFVYTGHAANLAGRGRTTATFEGMCRYLASSLTALGVGLTTTKSNY